MRDVAKVYSGVFTTTAVQAQKKDKRQKAVHRLVTALQGGHTKVHLGFCLRFSTLISQIGRVPLFGAGPRRYIRSRLFRLAVTAFWRALPASWRQKGKRQQIFPQAIRTTELPSNPSPLTFGNNQIQILQTSSTHATMAAANVSQQDTNTHGTGQFPV